MHLASPAGRLIPAEAAILLILPILEGNLLTNLSGFLTWIIKYLISELERPTPDLLVNPIFSASSSIFFILSGSPLTKRSQFSGLWMTISMASLDVIPKLSSLFISAILFILSDRK